MTKIRMRLSAPAWRVHRMHPHDDHRSVWRVPDSLESGSDPQVDAVRQLIDALIVGAVNGAAVCFPPCGTGVR